MENILVRYKPTYKPKKEDDLICSLTEFMDEYITVKDRYYGFKTYIYNDILLFSKPQHYYQVAFRVPGATRGGIRLEKINDNLYKILEIHFNEDSSFGDIGCYDKSILQDIERFVGSTLDFSQVYLVGSNKVV